MHLNVEERYNAVVFHLRGRLMGGPDAKNIEDRVRNLIDQGKKHIVLDMSGVHFMNSTGLGILISSYATIKRSGGDLRLAAMNDKIEGVLSITKLNQILPEYESVDAAVKSIN